MIDDLGKTIGLSSRDTRKERRKVLFELLGEQLRLIKELLDSAEKMQGRKQYRQANEIIKQANSLLANYSHLDSVASELYEELKGE